MTNQVTLQPTHCVAVDLVIVTVDENDHKIKMYVTRQNEKYVLPGVLTLTNESEGAAVERIIKSKIDVDDPAHEPVNVSNYRMVRLNARTDVDRDSRGRVISLPVVTLATKINNMSNFVDINDLLKEEFMYDHKSIVIETVKLLKESITQNDNVLSIMPTTFTYRDVMNVYAELDERYKNMSLSNFKKQANIDRYLVDTDENRQTSRGRSSRLYTLKESEKSYVNIP